MPIVKCRAKDPATCRVHGTNHVTALKETVENLYTKLDKLDGQWKEKQMRTLADRRKKWEAYGGILRDIRQAETEYYSTSAGLEDLENQINNALSYERRELEEKRELALARIQIEETNNERTFNRIPSATKLAHPVKYVKPNINLVALGVPGARHIDKVFQIVSTKNGQPMGYLYRRPMNDTVTDWGTTANLLEAKSGIPFFRETKTSVTNRMINDRLRHDQILIERAFSEHIPEDHFPNPETRALELRSYIEEVLSEDGGKTLKALRDRYKVVV